MATHARRDHAFTHITQSCYDGVLEPNFPEPARTAGLTPMGLDAPSGEIAGGRLARAAATGILARYSGEGCLPWCTCRKIDTCGIRTHAGRPHRLSRPTPEPLGQSVHVVGSGAVPIHRLHHRHGWQIAVMAVVCSGATISRSGAGGSSPSGVIRVPQGPAGVEMCRSSQVDVTRLGVGPRAWSRLHACLLVRGLAAQAARGARSQNQLVHAE